MRRYTTADRSEVKQIVASARQTQTAAKNLATYLDQGGTMSRFVNFPQLMGCPPGTKVVRLTVVVNYAGTDTNPNRTGQFGTEVDIANARTLNQAFSMAFAGAKDLASSKGYHVTTEGAAAQVGHGIAEISAVECR